MSDKQFDVEDIKDAQVDVGAQPPAEPEKSALKDEWVDHAVSQGADEKEAKKMTKAELQAEYGGTRTDASGRVLNPWESAPKSAE